MNTSVQTGHKLSEGFDPSNYQIIEFLDNQRPEYVGEGVEVYEQHVAFWKQNMIDALGEDYAAKIHRCIHCGNGRVRWITAAVYTPTGERVVFGNDCTERLGFTGRDALKVALLKKRAERRAESLRQYLARVEWLKAHPEVVALIEQAKLDVHKSNSFVADVLSKIDRWGSISEKQIAAVTASLARDLTFAAARAEEAKANGLSNFVGTEGGKLAVAVTCVRVGGYERPSFNGRYEEFVHVCTFRDATGNILVTKTPAFSVEVGAAGVLSGTVKAHSTYKEVKQTQVIRPKLTVG